VACITGTTPCIAAPASWSSPPRKQLPPSVLQQRASIVWDIPKQDVLAMLGPRDISISSPATVYVSGTGVQLSLQYFAASSSLGLFTRLVSYPMYGEVRTLSPSMLSCKYTITRLVANKPQPLVLHQATGTLHSCSEWGISKMLAITSASDLEPHLVDGCLKLRLTFKGLVSSGTATAGHQHQ
jgi:hypothetical protein